MKGFNPLPESTYFIDTNIWLYSFIESQDKEKSLMAKSIILESDIIILAKATKRPKSFYVREALERSIDDIEDAYLAEATYEDFLKSGEKAIPLIEVERSLDLEN